MRIARGISQYVSAVLLAMIVLGAGSFLLIYFKNVVELRQQLIEQEALKAEMASKQVLVPLVSTIRSGYMTILLVTGDFPLKVLDIYVNGTLYNSNCVASPPFRTEASPHTVINITCSVPSNTLLAEVVVVYGYGKTLHLVVTP